MILKLLLHYSSTYICSGAHILSGAVIEPRALNELIPNWKDKGVIMIKFKFQIKLSKLGTIIHTRHLRPFSNAHRNKNNPSPHSSTNE